MNYHATWKRRFLLLVLIGSAMSLRSTDAAGQLPARLQAEFGAATSIPDDAAYFFASYRSRERWDSFTQTRVYQQILTMPVVQMGLGWVQQQPYLDQLAMMREQNPLLDQGLDVLLDAIGQEMFFYADARSVGFINQTGGLYNRLFLISFLQGLAEGFNRNAGPVLPAYSPQDMRAELLRDALDAKDDLRVPGIVFGFRLSNPEAGRELLASLTPLLQQSVPLPMQEESLAGGEYLTVSLQAAMFLSPSVIEDLESELGLLDIDEATADEFLEFLRSQTLSISLGLRGDYLLLSLGADNSHLKKLGTGVSLAESEAVAPVRKHFRSRLIGLSYVHPDLTGLQKFDLEAMIAGLEELLRPLEGQMPDGLADRLITDATAMLGDINASLPFAKPYIAASFWNEGIEAFSFSALPPGSLVSTEPLRMLSHAGKAPLLAVAANSPPSLPHYNQLVSWLKTFYSYFEDYAAPNISPEKMAEFEKFKNLVFPALEKFHVTTRDLFIPSLDEGQGLFLLDAGGLLSRSPEDQAELSTPIRLPRMAIAVEVNDADKLVAACHQYREIVNELLSEVAKTNPNVNEVRLPAPQQRSFANGTLYTYPLPTEYDPAVYLDDDFEPHALLTKKHLVLSLSPRHSQQILGENRLPKSDLVDLDLPAGRAVWFDFSVLKDLICDDTAAILGLLEEEGEIDANTNLLIKIHVDTLRQVLGGVHNYRSRTFEESGLSVTHSWLKLQDLEP